MTMPPSTLGAFAKSDPALGSADLEWHVQPLSLPKFGEPLHPFGAITPSVCNLRPSSRGRVRIDSPDPLTNPKIFCNYLSTDADRGDRREGPPDDPADHGGASSGPLCPRRRCSRTRTGER